MAVDTGPEYLTTMVYTDGDFNITYFFHVLLVKITQCFYYHKINE